MLLFSKKQILPRPVRPLSPSVPSYLLQCSDSLSGGRRALHLGCAHHQHSLGNGTTGRRGELPVRVRHWMPPERLAMHRPAPLPRGARQGTLTASFCGRRLSFDFAFGTGTSPRAVGRTDIRLQLLITACATRRGNSLKDEVSTCPQRHTLCF